MSDEGRSPEDSRIRVEGVARMAKNMATMICDEQPDVPQPESVTDLDSFSMVQVLLELENTTGLNLLERFEGFKGTLFDDLAVFVVRVAEEEGALERLDEVSAVYRPDEDTEGLPVPATEHSGNG